MFVWEKHEKSITLTASIEAETETFGFKFLLNWLESRLQEEEGLRWRVATKWAAQEPQQWMPSHNSFPVCGRRVNVVSEPLRLGRGRQCGSLFWRLHQCNSHSWQRHRLCTHHVLHSFIIVARALFDDQPATLGWLGFWWLLVWWLLSANQSVTSFSFHVLCRAAIYLIQRSVKHSITRASSHRFCLVFTLISLASLLLDAAVLCTRRTKNAAASAPQVGACPTCEEHQSLDFGSRGCD